VFIVPVQLIAAEKKCEQNDTSKWCRVLLAHLLILFCCQTKLSLLFPEPGPVRGLRITRLVSTAAQVMWSRLSCREHNGVAVGYMYELTRRLQHSQQPLNVMFGIINSTVLDLSSLIPFTNYTVRVRFANHLYQGPRTALDFVTFEDCK